MGNLSEYTGGNGGWGTMISRCEWCGEIVSEYETDSEGHCTVPIFDDSENHRCPCEDEELEETLELGLIDGLLEGLRLGLSDGLRLTLTDGL